MANPEKIEYTEDNLIAGVIESAYKTADAATFHRGQLLGRVTASNKYAAWNSGASDGSEVIKAVCAADSVLTATGEIPTYINGSVVLGSALVDAAGDPLTVTDQIIEDAQDAGIIIK